MTPFEAYQEYTSLKFHFTQKKYDYFKYNGKTKTSLEKFETKKDRFFFAKLAKHKDVKGFLISNFLIKDSWVGELVSSKEAEKIYNEWNKKQQSLNYEITSELRKLDINFDSNIIVKDYLPFIIKLYFKKEISLETLIAIMDVSSCLKYWNDNIENPLWDNLHNLIIKYRPFLNYDKQKIIDYIIDNFD